MFDLEYGVYTEDGYVPYEETPVYEGESAAASPGLMERFRDAAQRFANAYAQISTLAIPVDAPEYGEWLQLINTAQNMDSVMQSIANGAADAWTWVKSTVGLSGSRRLARMGVIPLLGVAAVTAGIAALVAVTNNMMQFTVNWKRAEAGKKPVTGGDGDAFGSISGIVKWVVIGGALYMLLPEVTRISQARIR